VSGFIAKLWGSVEEVRSGLSRGEPASREQILALMRTSRVADRVARQGHWQEALTLLEAATKGLPHPEGASPGTWPLVPEADPPLSPEGQYRQAREVLAKRARETLGGALEQPLAAWRGLWRRAALVFALIAATALAPAIWDKLRDRDLTVGASWRASSASLMPSSGTFSRLRIYESLPSHFFHSDEQADPYIDIDLRSVHAVHRVIVVNRHDCCYERARGLKILLSLDGESFSVVAERDTRSIFRRWDVTLKRAQARYVRLQLRGDRRILHLSDVRVYGQ